MNSEWKFLASEDTVWLEDSYGRKIAEINFPEVRSGVVNIIHTEVDPTYGGQGLAGRITEEAAKLLRSQHRKAELACSYAVRWFAGHPEYADVLENPDAEAEKAGITHGPACGIRPPQA